MQGSQQCCSYNIRPCSPGASSSAVLLRLHVFRYLLVILAGLVLRGSHNGKLRAMLRRHIDEVRLQDSLSSLAGMTRICCMCLTLNSCGLTSFGTAHHVLSYLSPGSLCEMQHLV